MAKSNRRNPCGAYDPDTYKSPAEKQTEAFEAHMKEDLKANDDLIAEMVSAFSHVVVDIGERFDKREISLMVVIAAMVKFVSIIVAVQYHTLQREVEKKAFMFGVTWLLRGMPVVINKAIKELPPETVDAIVKGKAPPVDTDGVS